MSAYTLREEVVSTDREAVRRLAAESGAFSPGEVEVAVELVDERLAQGAASDYLFLFAEEVGAVRGYVCYGLIPLTRQSYDLYWIVVDRVLHGQGLGRRLMAAMEERVRALGGQQVFIDTSGRPDYAAQQAFYARCGYQIAARLADFYAPGDDKLIYARRVAE